VHWASKLPLRSEDLTALLTLQYRAGVSPYTSPFGLAETCVFDKQSLGPIHCGSYLYEHPFSRSYGVILPSSLTRVRSLTLEFSSQLPVSVTVRAVYILAAASLGSVIHQLRLLNFSSPSQLTVTQGGFAYPDHSLLGHALPSACLTILLRHHFA